MPLQHDDAGEPKIRSALSVAHGQAALILVETLLHQLAERSILSVEETRETAQSAVEVQADFVTEAGDDEVEMEKAYNLLVRIACSLAIDAEGSAEPLH